MPGQVKDILEGKRQAYERPFASISVAKTVGDARGFLAGEDPDERVQASVQALRRICRCRGPASRSAPLARQQPSRPASRFALGAQDILNGRDAMLRPGLKYLFALRPGGITRRTGIGSVEGWFGCHRANHSP
jgi:hypothetical protein